MPIPERHCACGNRITVGGTIYCDACRKNGGLAPAGPTEVPILADIADDIVKRLRARDEVTGELKMSDAQAHFAVTLHLAVMQMQTMQILTDAETTSQ